MQNMNILAILLPKLSCIMWIYVIDLATLKIGQGQW
jgi:hypothetical protein